MRKVKLIISTIMISIVAMCASPVSRAAGVATGAAPDSGIQDLTARAPLTSLETDAKKDSGPNATDSSGSSLPSRWTVSAETLIFDRVGTAARTLVERTPGSVAFNQTPYASGVQALNSTDLDQGFSPGFRLDATYQVDSNYSLEMSFLRVGGWESSRSLGPDNPPDWLVMKAPGGFFQTQDFPYQKMIWDYSTDLYGAECNLRHNLSNRITLLFGFRWLQLNENLTGSLAPPDSYEPLWKRSNPGYNLFDVEQVENQGTPATGGFPPFWSTSTTNNLFGLQFGAEGELFERGRFSIDGVMKAGGYLNRASESTGVSIQKIVYPSSSSTNNAAFVGELGLQFKYRFTSALDMKLGYEAIWLECVATAPGQIQETYVGGLASVTSLGVNSDSGVLFHGVTAGLEYSF